MAELDPKKLEARKIKRMRYFDGLFLRQEEFNLEQNYHIRMRRLNNYYLHSYGIVRGLEVAASTTSSSTVIISPGMALVQVLNNLDYENTEAVIQEIVITDPTSVDFSKRELLGDQTQTTGPKSVTRFIYVSHTLEKIDIYDDRGGKEQIHWWEKAAIQCEAAIPEEKLAVKEIVVLAKVELTIDGEVITVSKVSYSHAGNQLRTYTGNYGNLTLPVELDGGTSDNASNPMILGKKINGQNGILVNAPVTDFNGKISLTTGNLADEPYISGQVFKVGKKQVGGIEVKAPLTNIDGDFIINGNFTVVGGGSAHIFTKEAEVEDNILRINKYDETLGPDQVPKTAGIEIYRGEKLEVAQILWDEEKDRWMMGVKSNLIDISSLTDQSVVDIHRHNSLYTISSQTANATPALSVSEVGNIGIGTLNPLRKLQIEGDTLINGASSGANAALEVRGPGAGLGLNNNTQEWRMVNQENSLQIINVTGNKVPITIKPEAPSDELVITSLGIGIGTATPQAKLQVSGGAIMPSSGNSNEAGLLFRTVNLNIGESRDDGDLITRRGTNPGTLTGLGSRIDPGMIIPTRAVNHAWVRHYFEGNLAVMELGGAHVIGIMPSGSFGVGTTTPAQKLHVYSEAGTGMVVEGGQGAVKLGLLPGLGYNAEFGFKNNLIVGTITDNGLALSEKLRIDATGKVGIGVSEPQAMLDVAGTIHAAKFVGDGSALTGASQWGNIDGGDIFYNTGNVGIGTQNPQAKLQVAGGAIMPSSGNAENMGIMFHAFELLAPSGGLDIRPLNNPASGISTRTLTLNATAATNLAATVDLGTVIKPGTRVPIETVIKPGTAIDLSAVVPAGTTIQPGTTVDLSSIIKPGTTIDLGTITPATGSATEIKPGTTVDLGSIIKPGTTIDLGSIVQPGTTVQPGTKLDLGSVIKPGTSLDLGSAIKPGVTLDPGVIMPRRVVNTSWIRHYLQNGTAFLDMGGSDIIALRPNSNVGIGTLTPSTKLEVNGTVKAASFIGDGSQLTGITVGSSQWSNVESGPSGVYYNQGNVGIGTSNPEARLDVNGILKVAGKILFGDYKTSLNHWGDTQKHQTVQLCMDEIWMGQKTAYEFNIGHNEVYSYRSEEGGARYTFSKAFSVKETGDLFAKGNVGVGTETPQAKLDVNGTFRVNNGTIFKKVQAGSVRVGKSNYDSYKTCTIYFPNIFLTSQPRIILTPRYQGNEREFFMAMCRATSRNQAEIAVMRLDRSGGWAQDLIIDWYAWEEVIPYGAYGYGYGMDYNFEGIGGHLI
jgi:hypothetical protein